MWPAYQHTYTDTHTQYDIVYMSFTSFHLTYLLAAAAATTTLCCCSICSSQLLLLSFTRMYMMMMMHACYYTTSCQAMPCHAACRMCTIIYAVVKSIKFIFRTCKFMNF